MLRARGRRLGGGKSKSRMPGGGTQNHGVGGPGCWGVPADDVLLHTREGGRVLPHAMGGGHGLTLEVEAVLLLSMLNVEETVQVNLEKETIILLKEEAILMLKEVPVQVDLEEKERLLLEK